MAKIIVVTGPFSSGKTEMVNGVIRLLGWEDRAERVADGPHLVNIIRGDAHGPEGNQSSASHFHAWNSNSPVAPHIHHEGDSHFPFTVIDPEVSREMFTRTAAEILEKSSGILPVVVELGTGRRVDCQVSQADFSTRNFLEATAQAGILPDILDRVKCVIGIDADWETRIGRNLRRAQEADGVTASWGMQEEGLHITAEADFRDWVLVDIPVLSFDNNGDGIEGMQAFIEGTVMSAIGEGNIHGKEGYY